MRYLLFLLLLSVACTQETYKGQQARHVFHKGDKVTFTDGFYKGCSGSVSGFFENPGILWGSRTEYVVDLEDCDAGKHIGTTRPESLRLSN